MHAVASGLFVSAPPRRPPHYLLVHIIYIRVDLVVGSAHDASYTLRTTPPSCAILGILGSNLRGMTHPTTQDRVGAQDAWKEVSRITTRACMLIHGVGIFLNITLLVLFMSVVAVWVHFIFAQRGSKSAQSIQKLFAV